MRERNPDYRRPRQGREGQARPWQEDEGRYGRDRQAQAWGSRSSWDRDRDDEGFESDQRASGYASGRGAYGGYEYGGESDRSQAYRGAASQRGYTRDRDFEDDDYDTGAWPGAARRDYGPAGYGSGTSFQRESGRTYAQRGEYAGQDTRHADLGGGVYHGEGEYVRGYSEEGYGRGRSGRGGGGRSFNDRWENAYGGSAQGGRTSGGSAQGSTGGYGSPQLQGYGRESMTGMGRRGLGPKNYTRSDERIREDINERLSDDDHLDASGIEVEVNEGVVTLTGTVEERWEKHRAEDIADGCSGVRDVHNQIRVGASSMQTSSMSPQSAGMSGSSGMGSGMGSSAGAGMGSSTGSGMGSSAGSGAGSSTGSGMGSSAGSSAGAGTGNDVRSGVGATRESAQGGDAPLSSGSSGQGAGSKGTGSGSR